MAINLVVCLGEAGLALRAVVLKSGVNCFHTKLPFTIRD